ncbi:PQQ-dependent sugar dehydrogenase [Thermogutta sp.]|uniref:PQQ-dependent sugar dehydrogenase n=1 Tax=Thermogutta sp. TaxID=1962930 RepID=UPI003C7ED391
MPESAFLVIATERVGLLVGEEAVDGGTANDPFGAGQDLKTLLGKILRIDVDHRDPGLAYAIPKDNPFAGRNDGSRGEIWAYGLRNVWRLAFDRVTGDLFAGDVGQNRYEEVDLIVRGGNYGWKIREGFHPFDPTAPQTGDVLIDPLVEYFRHEGMSVTGGRVYRGQRIPEFYGAYFYGDYVTGNVWILRLDENKQVIENRKVARTGLNISSFGEDAAGELYFTAFDGYVYRFRKRSGNLSAIAAAFPRKLSETGLFADAADLVPSEGLLPYDVNVPLWSDGAMKQRFLALPRGQSVTFSEKGQWQFPEGTVLVKTFFLPASAMAAGQSPRTVSAAELANPRQWRRLETRLLVRTPEGWQGYTYVWNDAQTDAELLDGAKTAEVLAVTPTGREKFSWYFPSRSDCMACHTPAAGFVLGLNTRQLNRPVVPGFSFSLNANNENAPSSKGTEREKLATHSESGASLNQIALWRAMGIFTEQPQGDPESWEAYLDWFTVSPATAEQRQELVRAYLDANCAMCHVPDGIVNRPDFRYHTPLERAQLIGVNPGQGQVGPQGSKIVRPGSPEASELWHRLRLRGPRQMPPLASNRADERAVSLVEQWIRDLQKTWQPPAVSPSRRR